MPSQQIPTQPKIGY